MAAYQPGDLVHVASFGKGIVRELRNNGRYLVEVKGRAMEVAASQLSPVDAKRTGRSSAKLARKYSSRGGSLDPPGESARTPPAEGGVFTLDLHGHTVESALEALDACLNDALLAGASELRVIHGKSGGKVKAAVHQRLRELPAASKFRLDPRNSGVTLVLL